MQWQTDGIWASGSRKELKRSQMCTCGPFRWFANGQIRRAIQIVAEWLDLKHEMPGIWSQRLV